VAHVNPFTDEQARTLVNLEQQYGVWMAAEQALAALPYDLRRKDVGGRGHLYEIHDRAGNGRSLGPWSDDNEAKFTAYREAKAAAKARREASGKSLNETARLCRALRVPMLASAAGPLLREADRRCLLGRDLLVVGTTPCRHMPSRRAASSATRPTKPWISTWRGPHRRSSRPAMSSGAC
jgi:hypothetical protein